ncbi:hypothetical protein D3C80_1533130 [compost metagenome]
MHYPAKLLMLHIPDRDLDAGLEQMPDDEDEGDNPADTLQCITPIPFQVEAVQVRLGLIGDIQPVDSMVEQRKPDAEQFQEEDKREAVQPQHTVSESGSATLHRRKIRQHVL